MTVNLSLKKGIAYFVYFKTCKEEEKVSFRFSVCRTRKWAYRPQLPIFDDIPIPYYSVYEVRKEKLCFSPKFGKLIFLKACFIFDIC